MSTPATPAATPDDSSEKPAPAPGRDVAKGPRRPYPPRQEKPYPDFPLYWCLRGYWACKRDSKEVRYTADWQESLRRFQRDEDARAQGLALPSQAHKTGGVVRDAVRVFLERQTERMDDGEISDVQLGKYRAECEHFAAVVGAVTRLRRLCGDEGPALFRRAKQAAVERGLVVAERHVYYVRKMLELANRRGLMPPANYGDAFDKPRPEQVARWKVEEEAQHGERAFTNEELREIVAGAWRRSPHLFAQVLLGLNAGFGADDCAILRDHMIDRDRTLIRSYRGKKMRKRVSPLWPVTLDAIDASRKLRPKPRARAKDDFGDRVFLTEDGDLVARKTVTKDDLGRVKRTARCDSIRLAFDRLVEELQAAHDGTRPLDRVERLVADGFFFEPRTSEEVSAELWRREQERDEPELVGPKVVTRCCNDLAEAGVLARKPGKRYLAVDGEAVTARVRARDAMHKAGRRMKFVRHKAGFYTLRAMFRSLAVGCGVDNDLIAVIKGQKFDRPVDEYYLRGDLRAKLFDVVDHVYRELFVGWSSPWPRA